MTDTALWWMIAGLGAVTYLIRLSFLAALAGRRLPEWLTEALGFVPVTVLPALVAPMIALEDGAFVFEPARIVAAAVGLGLGAGFGLLAAIFGAMATFAALTALGL
ncbi:MAG: AzlD domain-containing protein [Paracoccaceae bacterium]